MLEQHGSSRSSRLARQSRTCRVEPSGIWAYDGILKRNFQGGISPPSSLTFAPSNSLFGNLLLEMCSLFGNSVWFLVFPHSSFISWLRLSYFHRREFWLVQCLVLIDTCCIFQNKKNHDIVDVCCAVVSQASIFCQTWLGTPFPFSPFPHFPSSLPLPLF